MGRWSELMIESRSPRYCFSSEEYKEAKRESYSSKYNDIIEEKLIADCFYSPYCVVCSNQSSHKVCFDCENIFPKTSFSGRCSPCYDLIKQKLENFNSEELRKLAKRYKITRRKKEYIVSELLCINHPIIK